jgi:hypothetical protein
MTSVRIKNYQHIRLSEKKERARRIYCVAHSKTSPRSLINKSNVFKAHIKMIILRRLSF